MLNVTKLALASALVLAAVPASAQVPNVKYIGSMFDVIVCPQYTITTNADTEYLYDAATGQTVMKITEPNTLTLGVTTPGNQTDVIYHQADGRNIDFAFPALAAPLIYRTRLVIKEQGTDQGHPYIKLHIGYPESPPISRSPGSPTNCTRHAMDGTLVAVPRGF